MPIARIQPQALQEKLGAAPETRPLLLDVRLKYPYEHSSVTLPSAIRLAPGTTAFGSIPAGRALVAFDSDPEELVAEAVAAKLGRAGFHVEVLAGGIAAWMAAKLPTDSKPAPHAAAPPPGALKG